MAYNDIQRLRQQQIFAPPDFGYDTGVDFGMNYTQAPTVEQEPMLPPRQQGPLSQIGSNAPTFPITEGISSGQLPGTPVPRSPTPGPPSPDASLQATIDAINRVYTPEYTDRDRLRRLMDSVPEREEPSTARRLVAGGLGLDARQRRGTPGQELTATASPVETMEKVMYAPHLRNMADWTAKTEPYLKTAELENRGNINERTLAGNVVTSHTAAQRVAEQGRIADEKARISEIRAKAYAWKQMHPDWDWDTSGPTYVLKNPTTGEIKNTGIKTGQMSEEDLQILKNKGSVAAAEARGKSTLENTAVRGRVLVQDTKGNQYLFDPATKAIEPFEGSPDTPVGGLSRVGTPSQNRTTTGTGSGSTGGSALDGRVRNEKLGQAYQTDPETKPYIKDNGGGKYDFKPRPVVGDIKKDNWGTNNDLYTQEDVDKYDEFRHSIEPNYTPPRGIAPTGTPKQETVAKPGIGPTYKQPAGPPLPEEFKVKPSTSNQNPSEVIVRDKQTGRTFAMRAENLKKAVETGRYEQVK